jgi:hypothetical protein
MGRGPGAYGVCRVLFASMIWDQTAKRAVFTLASGCTIVQTLCVSQGGARHQTRKPRGDRDVDHPGSAWILNCRA